MASEIGQQGAPLIEYSGLKDTAVFKTLRRQIDEEPFRFHFFQAVRLLQRMDPDRSPVGYVLSDRGEAIRFRSRPSLAFPASEIYDLTRDEEGQPHMTVEFMGLSASLSVLPAPYTELLMERIRAKDHAMEEFFNIFNHRVISLFYRGWEKYRYFVAYERSGDDKFSDKLFDLLGMGTDGLVRRTNDARGLPGGLGIPARSLLDYVSHLARQVRGAASLEQLLEEYFEVPVQVTQFVGTWNNLPEANRTVFTGQGDACEMLGRGTVVGDAVWDPHGRIGLTLGPMSLRRYLEFLPGQDAHRDLVQWLRFYSNGMYECEVKLTLEREEVPSCVLGSQDEGSPRLGLLTWLKTRPLERNPADATYLIQ